MKFLICARILICVFCFRGEIRLRVLKHLEAYLDKLKPQCESKAMSYEEKKARREAEIEGLQEAMAIIEGKGVAVTLVQKKRSLRTVRKSD